MALPFSKSFRRKLCGGTTVADFGKWVAIGGGDITIPDTLETVYSTPQSVAVTYDDVTMTFSNISAYGTYLDGSYWFKPASGGTTWTRTGAVPQVLRPEWIPNPNASSPAFVQSGNQIMQDCNGAMINPGNRSYMAGLADMSSMVNRQTYNNGGNAANYGMAQGYDCYTGAPDGSNGITNAEYNPAWNAGMTGALTSEATIVTAVSKIDSFPINARTILSKLVPWTVVDAKPAKNSFRPATASTSKASTWSLANVDLSGLPNLSAADLSPISYAAAQGSSTAIMPTYDSALSRLRYQTWQMSNNASTRNVTADADGAPVYGGDFWKYAELLLGLCLNTWSPNRKKMIAVRLIQFAIDIIGRAEEGAIIQDNGGHCSGRKGLVVFAAWALNDSNLAAYADRRVVSDTNFAKNQPLGSSIWGDDALYNVIWPEYVTRTATRIVGTNALQSYAQMTNKPYTSQMVGWPEWDSAGTSYYLSLVVTNPPTTPPVSGDKYGGYWQNVMPEYGSLDPNNLRARTYRQIGQQVAMPTALALNLMPGARAIWNYDPFFDYADRHMQAMLANGAPLTQMASNDYQRWHIGAWERYRAGAGNVWSTSNLHVPAPNVTSLTATDAGNASVNLTWRTWNGSGSIYYVVSTSATAPTAAQIIAGKQANGTNASVAGSIACTYPSQPQFKPDSAITNGIAGQLISGLPSGQTVYFYAVQQDQFGTIGAVTTSNALIPSAGPTTPSAFADNGWSLEDEQSVTGGLASITLLTLPYKGSTVAGTYNITDVQYSVNGGSTWVSIGTTLNTKTYISGFTDYHPSQVIIRALNSLGNGAEAFKQVTTTGDPAKLARFVTPNANATASSGAGSTFTPGTVNDKTKVEFSAFVRLRSGFTGPAYILRASLGIGITISTSGVITFSVWDSGATAIYNAKTSPNVVLKGKLAHIYATYDYATATPVLIVNGSTQALTATVGPLSGTGLARVNRLHYLVTDSATKPSVDITDYWLAYTNSFVGVANFLRNPDDGSFPDLTGVGAPQVWCGGNMLADADATGNTARGWNDGYNKGSATFTVTSTGWTDVT
jgi:hypothetical protein